MDRKILCLFLSLLLASTALMTAGCSEQSASGTDTPSNTPSAAGVTDTEAAEDEDEAFITDGLPEKDFGGETFAILTTSWYNAKKYIYADEMDGEVVNDALYNQRMKVSDRFNVNVTCNDDDDLDPVSAKVHNCVASGDDSFSIVYSHDNKTMNNGLKGDFCDLRSFEILDFSKPWWQGTPQVFTIQGKLFATANSMAMSGIYMNCTVSFNKKLFLTASYGWLQLQSDLGAGCMEKDAEGNVCFTGNVDRMISVMEKFDKMDEFTQSSTGTDYNVQMFSEGRGLFMFSENRNLYESMRESDVSYGILPAPKFDETQADYASAGYDIYWGVILSSAAHEELISYCVEAMSCENYNNVVPAVWETVLGAKLSDAPEDTEMFRIIRDCQYVDLGYALSQSIPGLSSIVFLKTNTTADATASFIQKVMKSLNKGTERLNKSYSELGG